MRAILIDTPARTVREVETTGELGDLYRLIGCAIVGIVRDPGSTEDIWLDDEGLLVDAPAFFAIAPHAPAPGAPARGNVYAGRALVLSCDSAGDCAPSKLTAASVRARVAFIDAEKAEA